MYRFKQGYYTPEKGAPAFYAPLLLMRKEFLLYCEEKKGEEGGGDISYVTLCENGTDLEE